MVARHRFQAAASLPAAFTLPPGFADFFSADLLDESLSVSSRMLEFVFRMFSQGDIAIPADGMAAIPRQLAERLPRGSLRLQNSVASLDGQRVKLTDGSVLSGRAVVVAWMTRRE